MLFISEAPSGCISIFLQVRQRFPRGSVCKESACNTGDMGSVPESGSSHGEGLGNPLQYSCLENPMDRGARRATVQGVVKTDMAG